MEIAELQKYEMTNISGGGLASPFINAVSKFIMTLYDLGEKTGSGIRRLTGKNYCKAN